MSSDSEDIWPPGASEMARRIRAFDWANTPLGPGASWSERLKAAVEMMLACPLIASIVCGPQRILIYNDAAARLYGKAHPAALGVALPEIFPAGYATVESLYDRAFAGESVSVSKQPLDTRNEGVVRDYFDAWLTPVRDARGNVIAVHMLGVEISERLAAQQALRKSEERLRRVLETDAVGVLFFNHDGILIGANDVFLAMTGWTRQDIESRSLNWRKMTPPEWAVESEAQMQALAETGRVGPYEKEYFRKDGSRAWMLFAGRDLGDGTVAEYAIDVTDRKRAEAALHASEEQYRVLFDSLDEGFCVIEMLFDKDNKPLDYRFLQVNHAFERQTGLAGAVGRTMRELAPAHEQHWFDVYGRIALTGEPARFEDKAAALGRWYDVYAFRAGEPEQRRVAILFRDVLPRKRTEERLRASEERFRALVTAGAYMLYRMSPDWRVMHQLTGRDFLADTAAPIEDWADVYLLPEDRPAISAVIAEAIRTTSMFDLEHRVRTADGGVAWVHSRAVPIFGPNGEIVEWFGTGVDINARKRAEAHLREREADLARVQRIGQVGGLNIVVADGLRSWRSPEYLRLHGLPESTAEESHMDWLARVFVEDRDGAEQTLFAALRSDALTYESEYRIVRPSDGAVRWIYARADIERVADGTPVRLVGAHVDVTEQKHMQDLQRESEARQAFLLNVSDALRPLADPAEIAETACRLLVEQFDASRAQYAVIEGEPGAETGDIRGEYVRAGAPMPRRFPLAPYGEAVLKLLRAGESLVLTDAGHDARLTDAAREAFRIVEATAAVAVPLVKNGRLVAALTIHDLTPRNWTDAEVALIEDVAERTWAAVERARAEMALAKSESRLRTLFDSIDEGFLEVEVVMSADGRAIDWRYVALNPAFERLSGLKDVTGKLISEFMPDLEPEWAERFAKVVSTGEAIRFELPVANLGRWFDVYVARIGGAGSRRLAIVYDNVTERKRAEEALRKSEERLRQFGEASQDVLWMRDAETFQWNYLTPAFETIYGIDRETALHGDNMTGWLELIVPEDRDHAAESLRRVSDGEWVTFEYRVRRPVDGQVRWLRNTDFPIADDTGRIVLIGGVGHDITALKDAEEQLRGSEQRLRLALDVAHMGTWDWNIPADEVRWSDEHFRLEGYEVGEVEPSYATWADRIHPDDRASVELTLCDARDRHLPYVAEFRSLHPDGTILWLSAVGRFFYDADGKPVRMIGVMQDVSERRAWQERQRVLVGELQHRTRNLMGLIRSMAEKTVRASADLPDFRRRFRGRLEALARVQGLLSRMNEHDRVTFDELIETELAAMNGGAGRAAIDGPRGVRLRSSTVQTLAMALHELATNAVKYGALGGAQGKLAVTWRLEPDGAGGEPWLHIDWRESGVTMPAAGSPPAGKGQGRELIENALPYQLNAKTSYTLGSDGVHCTISIPVSASTPAEEERHG